MLILLLIAPESPTDRTIDLLSGENAGSKPATAPGISSRKPCPFAATTYARQSVFSVLAMNTI